MNQEHEPDLPKSAGRRRDRTPPPPRREYRLTAQFRPTGPDVGERLRFWEYVTEVQAALLRRKQRAWKKMRGELVRLMPQLEGALKAKATNDPVTRASHRASHAVEELVRAGMVGNGRALKALAGLAIQATTQIAILERLQPEAVRAVARRQVQWPTLLNGEPGIEARAEKLAARLELGAALGAGIWCL